MLRVGTQSGIAVATVRADRKPNRHGAQSLHIDGLTYVANGSRLIDDLSLKLPSSGRTVIMGPNGAGKSLLLRLIHGLIEPTSGSIYWTTTGSPDAARPEQAMVFQRPVLLRRSVAANIAFVLRSRGCSKSVINEQTDRLLELGRLSTAADRPARRLSGGEQQRLAIVRALAIQPKILFLDEPTSSLDPASTLAIEQLIRRADEDGCKIVLATHDLGQARRLADDVVFLNSGRLEIHEPASLFFNQTKSKAARAFMAGELLA